MIICNDYTSTVDQHVRSIKVEQLSPVFQTSTFLFKKEIVPSKKKTYFADIDLKITEHISAFTDLGVDSPVRVEEGKIRMSVKRMEPKRFYSVEYSGKKIPHQQNQKGCNRHFQDDRMKIDVEILQPYNSIH